MGGPVSTDAEESRLEDGQPATAAIGNLRQVALLGEAGSGKSTVVSALILGLCQRAGSWTIDRLGPLLPLPLVLRDFRFGQLPEKDRWSYLLEIARVTLPEAEGLRAALPEYLARGQVLVLVDGWDEVPMDTRTFLGLALDALRELAPGVAILITSRPLGWREAPYRRPGFASREASLFDAGQPEMELRTLFVLRGGCGSSPACRTSWR